MIKKNQGKVNLKRNQEHLKLGDHPLLIMNPVINLFMMLME